MFDLIGNLQFSVHGSGSGGGMAGMLDDSLLRIEGLLNLSPKEAFASLFPGSSAMENIHPLFVHFPIALLTVFFLVDLEGSLAKKSDWRQVAGWFLYGGTVFAGLAVLAGLAAASTVMHGEDVHEIMETHEHYGISIFTLATVLSGWRLIGIVNKGALQGVLNGLYLACAAVLCVLLVFGADFGGLMVYKYGVGVEAARSAIAKRLAEHPHEHDHEHEHSHSE
ncbi:MAG: DUF2231 domain-containing protein [Methylomonas sp.]